MPERQPVSGPPPASERRQLQEAITALEAQRASLGDDVVEAALAPLRERLALLELHSSGERRIVTVLFCDVAGSTSIAEQMDPEEWAHIMNSAFEHIIAAIDHLGGTVTRLLGDAVVAFFGAPAAHEDDPERAVRAGLDILEGVRPLRQSLRRQRALDFDVRVGINTGLVIVGEAGSDVYGEYTAMGDAVNLAARMEQTARPGTVQITEDTYRLVQSQFDCRPLGAMTVKGKKKPVQAYQVLGRRYEPGAGRGLAGYGLYSPHVGRRQEFGQAREALNRLLTGEGGFCYIVGEAGIGKSRLLVELRDEAARHARAAWQLRWLEGGTLTYGQTISYWPFREILWQYAAITEEDSETEAWRKLSASVAQLFPAGADDDDPLGEIVPYLSTLLALPVSQEYQERINYLDGEAMGQQIIVASRRFFQRLAQEQPLVLVFEDLHWADASSARLLEHLLPLMESMPLLIYGLSRPEAGTPGQQMFELASERYPQRTTLVALKPLSPETSEEMVQRLLGLDELSPALRRVIWRTAEGNPFFLEEIIRHLIEVGAIVHDEDSGLRGSAGRWRATTGLPVIAVPKTIQGVVAARVDRLNRETRSVLRTAAVIGRSFLYRVLRAVVDPEIALDQRLKELEAAALIVEKQRLPELEYMFKHALARDATYQSILLQRRRELHARAGLVIEALFADRLDQFYSLLAYHYSQAESWPKAQEYLLLAGDSAGRLAADAEALANYLLALAAYERAFGEEWDAGQRAALARKMGEAHYGLGHLAESSEEMKRALLILDRPLPANNAGLLVAIAGQALRQAAHRLWPARFLGRAPAADQAGLRQAVLVHLRLATIMLFQGQSISLLYPVLRALNLAEAAGQSPELARMYGASSLVAGLFRLRSLAEGYDRLALAAAEMENDPGTLAYVLQTTGTYFMGVGRWAEAADRQSRAAAINRRIGQLRAWEESTGNLALIASHQGQFDRYGQLFRAVCHSAGERGDAQSQFWGLCGQAVAALRLGARGHAAAALALLRQAQALLVDYHYEIRPDEIRLYGILAQAHVRLGDWEAALTAANAASEHIAQERWPTAYYVFEGYAGAPPVYLALWRGEKEGSRPPASGASYRQRARRACQGLHTFARVFPLARPRAWLWQGNYEWLAGKSGPARRAWRQSLACAVDLNMPYEQALAHFQMGRHLQASQPARAAHLQKAVALFERLETAWDLARARLELELGG